MPLGAFCLLQIVAQDTLCLICSKNMVDIGFALLMEQEKSLQGPWLYYIFWLECIQSTDIEGVGCNFDKKCSKSSKQSFLIFPLQVVVVAVMPDVEGRFKLKAMGEDNYPTTYARESKPYSNLMFDKELPYVPRYR